MRARVFFVLSSSLFRSTASEVTLAFTQYQRSIVDGHWSKTNLAPAHTHTYTERHGERCVFLKRATPLKRDSVDYVVCSHDLLAACHYFSLALSDSGYHIHTHTAVQLQSIAVLSNDGHKQNTRAALPVFHQMPQYRGAEHGTAAFANCSFLRVLIFFAFTTCLPVNQIFSSKV